MSIKWNVDKNKVSKKEREFMESIEESLSIYETDGRLERELSKMTVEDWFREFTI